MIQIHWLTILLGSGSLALSGILLKPLRQAYDQGDVENIMSGRAPGPSSEYINPWGEQPISEMRFFGTRLELADEEPLPIDITKLRMTGG